MIAFLAHFVIVTISALGYLGIAGLMALESMCIPVPSEVILPFAGYLVSTGRFDLWAVTIVAALGCNIGSTIAYGVGYYGGRPLVERFGRYILLDRAELAKVEGFFARRGAVTVLISRMLPVIRTYIALPAGIARMNFWVFQAFTFAGSLPWCFALTYAGYRLGRAWQSNPRLQAVMHGLTLVTAGGILMLGGWYFIKLGLAQRSRAAGVRRANRLDAK